MVSIQVIFQPHISQNVAKSMPSLTSQSCGNSMPAVCLSRQDGSIYRPPRHSWMLDRLKKTSSVKADHCMFGYSTSTHINLVYCCIQFLVQIYMYLLTITCLRNKTAVTTEILVM